VRDLVSKVAFKLNLHRCLTVQQPQLRAGVAPGVDRVALEVDRATLEEMVGTFAGIRDQLVVMTNK
jgi:hypothetical protein